MTIFCLEKHAERILRLQALAEFFGIESSSIDFRDRRSCERLFDEPEASRGPVVFDLASLSRFEDSQEIADRLLRLIDAGNSILLLATASTPEETTLLVRLANGGISGIVQVDGAKEVRFPSGSNLRDFPLSGHSFRRAQKPGVTLALNTASGINTVMTLGDTPSFVSIRSGSAELFVWSTKEVFDIHKPLKSELEFEQAKDEYVPAIVFLRAACGERCWRNPQTDAGFVIDDPLLQKRYGFIDFPALLRSARDHHYRVTLAFIPWNHRRTKISQISDFLEHRDCFSVCLHGCDHNNNEYGAVDYDTLLAKNERAISRMERHRQRTGIDYEPLIVCPQEQCSTEGWRAFADCNRLLAMVNTGCMPRNLTEPRTCAADLLAPAQDAFFGFPIFKRHYWGDSGPFAMALFLGKPAILVEHHEFFRPGLGQIEAFVHTLRGMAPDIQWRPLSTVVRETHLQRRASCRRKEIRFFARHFDLHHSSEEPVTFRLRKRVSDPSTVRAVMVNGTANDFDVSGEYITFEVYARSRETFRIVIEPHPVKSKKPYSFGLKYHTGVALRRGLSEFRDNIMSQNQKALKVGRSIMSAFGLTGRR